MTKILDAKFPVVMGNCIHVANEDEPDSKERILVCIQVEDETGKVEYPIMLTQDDYSNLKLGEFPNMDNYVFGRVYPMRINDVNYYCVKLRDVGGSVFMGMFKLDQWKQYYTMALRHPKSVTKKSLITDLFD